MNAISGVFSNAMFKGASRAEPLKQINKVSKDVSMIKSFSDMVGSQFETPKVIAIYNKFDVDSTIAAAVLVDNGITVLDNTKSVPKNAEEYIWLGTQPNITNGTVFNNLKNKKHQYFKEKKVLSEDDEYFDLNFDNTMSIFEQVCDAYNEGHNRYLGHKLVKFNTKYLTREDLGFIFVNLKKAISTINGVGSFSVKQFTESDEEAFKLYVKETKYKLNGAYGIQYVDSKQGLVKTAITYLTEDCHLALRMVRLAHPNYANIVVTANGCMIDTNLPDIRGLVIDGNLINSRMM